MRERMRYPYQNWWLGWLLFGVVVFIAYFWWVIMIIGLALCLLSVYRFVRDEFDQQQREVTWSRVKPVGEVVGTTPAPRRRQN